MKETAGASEVSEKITTRYKNVIFVERREVDMLSKMSQTER